MYAYIYILFIYYTHIWSTELRNGYTKIYLTQNFIYLLKYPTLSDTCDSYAAKIKGEMSSLEKE